MSLSRPNLKGSSPTSFELVCKSGLKIPRQQFTKKLFWDEKRLYKTQGTNASRLQGRGSLTLKELSCTKCFTMIQPATVTLCFNIVTSTFSGKKNIFTAITQNIMSSSLPEPTSHYAFAYRGWFSLSFSPPLFVIMPSDPILTTLV